MVGINKAIKTAGDLVRRAPPRVKPVSMAISSLLVLAVSVAKKSVQMPNMARSESTNAIRSKKKEKGDKTQIREDTRETILLLKSK